MNTAMFISTGLGIRSGLNNMIEIFLLMKEKNPLKPLWEFP